MADNGFVSIGDLETRIKNLETLLERPRKDLWDRLSAVSGIVSGVLVAVIGFYATNIYDKRSRNAEQADRERNVVAVELQTVEKFFPHLISHDETEKQGAIQVISTLANPELAAKVAAAFGGPGARAALTNIAINGTPAAKASVQIALTDLFKQFSGSVGAIQVETTGPTGTTMTNQGTCVVIGADGYALTVAHLFTQSSGSGARKINLSLGSRSAVNQVGDLISTDAHLDLALIKIRINSPAVPVSISTEQLQVGEAVSALGFAIGQDLTVTSAIVSSLSGPNGSIITTISGVLGDSGSPIFNSRGELVGTVTGGSTGTPVTFAVPAQAIRSFLSQSGLK